MQMLVGGNSNRRVWRQGPAWGWEENVSERGSIPYTWPCFSALFFCTMVIPTTFFISVQNVVQQNRDALGTVNQTSLSSRLQVVYIQVKISQCPFNRIQINRVYCVYTDMQTQLITLRMHTGNNSSLDILISTIEHDSHPSVMTTMVLLAKHKLNIQLSLSHQC